MKTMSIFHWGKRSLLACLCCVLLASCAKGTDTKLLQDVSSYNFTTHQEYTETYAAFLKALYATQYDETEASINKFMAIQTEASAFWMGVVLPPELEGHRAQILDSFTGAKSIEARNTQYTTAYRAVITGLFPGGVVTPPSQ